MLKTSQQAILRANQMMDDPAATPRKPRRKGGRPTRAEATAKALLGIDLAACDPVAILREIALDRSMPGSTRVAACRELRAVRAPDGSDGSAVAGDAVTPPAGRRIEMDEDDAIPIVEVYRGVGIEDAQPLERIQRVVKPEIDRVHAMSDPGLLFIYADDARNPPEARMLAEARAEALWEIAGEERRLRPISLERLRASTAGLGCRRWRDPGYYSSTLEHGGVPREEPLPDLE
jgi:hypothetical protein